MSWMKRAQPGAPPPGAERPPYAAPQPYGNQQDMYANYQSTPGNVQQQQQPQMWPLPQQAQYNQQYSQVYQHQQQQQQQQHHQHHQHQAFSNNSNQYYQQPPQYNQNFNNQNFTNVPQGYPQNYYPSQVVPQQNFTQNKVNSDGWEDNWDWGWEDGSKQMQKPVNQAAPQNIAQQAVFNNANVIEESFASTDTWDWSTDDKKETKDPFSVPPKGSEEPAEPVESAVVDNTASEVSTQKTPSNISSQNPSEEIRNLSDRDVVKERLPNLASGKRFNLENLTPQWSIESQMSQESSDGPQTHSEGTYRSENQSRNSSKSSPGPNTDNSNFNYSQSGYDDLSSQNVDWSKQSDEQTMVNNGQEGKLDQVDHLSNSMQDINISNHENLDTSHIAEAEITAENAIGVLHPAPSRSPANFHLAGTQMPTMPPAPPVLTTTLPTPNVPSPPLLPSTNPAPASSPDALSVNSHILSSATGSVPPSNSYHVNTTASIPPPNFPPPSSTSSVPPPANFASSSQNPFKHAGPFSHKNLPKGQIGNPPAQAFPSQMSNSNLTSPAAVSKVSQNRVAVGFGANLETTPDNSERPDQPQVSSYRPLPVTQQVPDNLEIAPQNDRNEYLQTAHLSSGDYGENTDFSRDIPLPGLRRMGVGQQDSEYAQNLNISGDEPPPGLARMVPGQQTETDHSFNQTNDNYMDRQIDGQPTDNSRRPYRQADGQQTQDNYAQPPPSRGSERRPIGLDRMVPGEPSNDEFLQYQVPSYSGSNEQRVVTGVDRDYSIPVDAGLPDVREQNVDGSDYTDQSLRNPSRDIMGARDTNDPSPDYSAPLEDQQREVTVEGENLQDLSVVSSADASYALDPMYDGANANTVDINKDRNHDTADSAEYPVNNSRQSLNRITSGEDSERDRTFKSSPRRDRDKRKSSRDRDRDRDRARDRDRDKDGRYSRSDRKFDRDADRRSVRDERRPDKDRRDKDRDRERDRRARDESPESRRYRRKAHKYETEDTDYYSDREKERRRYREGSYASKPPRPDDKDRRYEERDRNRRYNTIERDRRYDDERDGPPRRHRERYERAYRDIDPSRRHANARRERDDDERRRGSAYSSPSRPGSREAAGTDEEPAERRRERDEPRRARTARPDGYYDGYAGAAYDPYALQRRQYEYYERLRRTDPAAYMRIYKQLMAGHAPMNVYAEGYGSMGYEGARGEERGSVHSGRSSANGLKGNDTCGYAGEGYARTAASLLTDYSDRELTTDASLNLQLEDSTVRSERMTPFKYSTAHIKGSMSARALVVVRASYPVDGLPATVQLLPLAELLAADPALAHLHGWPGPLVKGVTHKKSVLDYCAARARDAAGAGARDPRGYGLVWELLALLLRQNGVVVGTDIAELLMKNVREYEYEHAPPAGRPAPAAPRADSRRESSVSGEGHGPSTGREGREERTSSPEPPSLSAVESIPRDESSSPPAMSEAEAVDKLRECLIYGNRQDALEWAASRGLWGHAWALAAAGGRRARAALQARWLAALPPADPLHTLHAALAARLPPAATCVADERWADWRPHAAILLANPSARPEQDRRTLTQMGDTLAARGLLFSAQFCYLAGGVPLAPHPLAPFAAAAGAGPPRLALLLADPRSSSLHQFATNQAIFATEIYEYALSLSHDNYVINELQVYKLVAATRLADAGLCERALGYAEQAARALARAPRAHPPALAAALARLADRLQYCDPALQEEAADAEEDSEPSPRHQWLAGVAHLAAHLSAEASQHTTPQHHAHHEQYVPQQQQQQQQQQPQPQAQYNPWADQTLQQYASEAAGPGVAPGAAPGAEEPAVEFPTPYYPPAPPDGPDHEQPYPAYGDDANTYSDYWNQDTQYGYNETSALGGGEAAEGGEAGAAPSITMPGAGPRRRHRDLDDDPPLAASGPERERAEAPGGGGGGGGAGGGAAGEARRGGWLGGFLTKLSLRPPNQMILPDDKNPTIVWDEQHKRWRNTDADEPPAPPPPPPALPLQNTSAPLQSPGAPPPGAPQSNMYKMQKSRHIKKAYVDVLNPGGGGGGGAGGGAGGLLPAAPPAAAPPAYFVPAPSGIYDPTQLGAEDEPYRSGI